MARKRGTYTLCFLVLLSFFMIGKTHAAHDIAVTKIGFEEQTVAAEEQPRYPQNPGGMEIMADAPWRVSSDQAIIPIQVIIKDASGVDPRCPGIYLESITIYDGLLDNIKIEDNLGGEFVSGNMPPWKKTYEDLKASDFTQGGSNKLIRVEVKYFYYDYFGGCFLKKPKTFTQYLRVYVGEELPQLTNWYCEPVAKPCVLQQLYF